AACSPVAAEIATARTSLGVQRLHADVASMLADSDVDAVVLATPTPLHADQVIAALRAGKHVFVEKPLALNVEDCERVEAVAAEHRDQVAMVGFVRRFDESYQHAHQAIADGTIGQPFMVRSQTADMNDESGAFIRFAKT